MKPLTVVAIAILTLLLWSIGLFAKEPADIAVAQELAPNLSATRSTAQAMSAQSEDDLKHVHQIDDEAMVAFMSNLASVVSETSRSIADFSTWTQGFITVMVALFGIAVIFLQQRERTYIERQISDLSEKIEGKVKEVVPDCLEKVLEEKYRDFIEEKVVVRTGEVLMQTPQARGLLLSRFRRLVITLERTMQDQAGSEVSREVANALGLSVKDWHSLGQLFSLDRAQIEKGLLAILADPFEEAKIQIQRLRVRHANDSKLVALIDLVLKKYDDGPVR